MRIQSQIDGQVLKLKLPEFFQHDALVDAIEQSVGEFAIMPPYPVLLDATLVQQASSAGAIARLAHRFGQLLDIVGPNFAVVVEDDLHFGLGRMFASLAAMEGCEVQVFKHETEAIDWLKAESGLLDH